MRRSRTARVARTAPKKAKRTARVAKKAPKKAKRTARVAKKVSKKASKKVKRSSASKPARRSKAKKGKKAASPWNKHLMSVFKELKRENPAVRLGDAMKAARKSYRA